MSQPKEPVPSRRRPAAKPKLRLLHVVVSPQFVLDHGSHLEPLPPDVINVPANQWPAWPEKFKRETRAFERQLLKQRTGT